MDIMSGPLCSLVMMQFVLLHQNYQYFINVHTETMCASKKVNKRTSCLFFNVDEARKCVMILMKNVQEPNVKIFSKAELCLISN